MNKEKLKELEIFDTIYSEYLKTQSCYKNVSVFIEQKRKELSEPVYKTEDGYEVKEGDEIFYVISPNHPQVLKRKFIHNEVHKQFFKKENAENYFIENAEVLSYKDIVSIDTILVLNGFGLFKDKLKQKIREKLGL